MSSQIIEKSRIESKCSINYINYDEDLLDSEAEQLKKEMELIDFDIDSDDETEDIVEPPKEEIVKYKKSLAESIPPFEDTALKLYQTLMKKFNKKKKKAYTFFELYMSDEYVKPHLDFDGLVNINDYDPDMINEIKEEILKVLTDLFTESNDWAISSDVRVVKKEKKDGRSKVEKTYMKMSYHFILNGLKCKTSNLKRFLQQHIDDFLDADIDKPDMAIYKNGENKFRMPYTKKSYNDAGSLSIALNYKDSETFHKHLLTTTNNCTITDFGVREQMKKKCTNNEVIKYYSKIENEISTLLSKFDILSTKHDDELNATFYNIRKPHFYCGTTHKSNHNFIIRFHNTNKMYLRCHDEDCCNFNRMIYDQPRATDHFSLKYMNSIPLLDDDTTYYRVREYFESFFIRILDTNSYYRKDYKRIINTNAHEMNLVPININGINPLMSYLKRVQKEDETDDEVRYNFMKIYAGDGDGKNYLTLKFDPYGYNENHKIENDFKYNLFDHFGYTHIVPITQQIIFPELSKYRFKLLVGYIKNILCGYNSSRQLGLKRKMDLSVDLFNFLMRYLKNIIEEPKFVPHLLMTFFSQSGTGKSGFLKFLTKLIGEHLCASFPLSRFEDNHVNEHVGKLVNIIEEVDPQTTKKLRTKLNDYSQRKKAPYNEKNIKNVEVDVYVRYLMTTNFGVYIQPNDRRYVLYKPDKINGNHDYINEISATLEDPNVVFLFGKYLESDNVKKVWHTNKDWENARPLTNIYYAMQSGEPIGVFLRMILDKEESFSSIATGNYIHKSGIVIFTKQDFHNMYKESCDLNTNGRSKSKLNFGKEINLHYGDEITSFRNNKILGNAYCWKINLKRLWKRLGLKVENFENNYTKSNDDDNDVNDIYDDEIIDEFAKDIAEDEMFIDDDLNDKLDDFLSNYGGSPSNTKYLKREQSDYIPPHLIKNKPKSRGVCFLDTLQTNPKPPKSHTKQSKTFDNTNKQKIVNKPKSIQKVQPCKPDKSISGELQFQILDIIGRDVNWKYMISIIGKTMDNKTVCLNVNAFEPSFYVMIPKHKQLKEFIDSIQSLFLSLKLKPNKYKIDTDVKSIFEKYNNEQNDVIKISFDALWCYRKAKKGLQNNYKLCNVESSEFIDYLMETKIKTSGWIGVSNYINSTKKLSKCEIEVDTYYDSDNVRPLNKSEVVNYKIASFDIETYTPSLTDMPNFNNSEDKIIQIGVTINNVNSIECTDRVIFTLGKCDKPCNGKVYECDTEEELITNWARYIESQDPDILTGYNILNFDYEYIAARAFKTGVLDELSRLSRLISTITQSELDNIYSCKTLESANNTHKWKLAKIYNDVRYGNAYQMIISTGRAVIDLLRYFNNPLMDRLKNYKLDTVAKNYGCENGKNDISYGDIFRIYKDGTTAEKGKVAEYCIQDCELCNQLIFKQNVVNNSIGMSSCCNVSINSLYIRGMGHRVYSLLYEECFDRDYIIPKIPSRDKKNYEGATVLDCESKLHRHPVSVLDFASLYPSSTIAGNICKTTQLTIDEVKEMDTNDYTAIKITDKKYHYFRKGVELGIFPSVMNKLLKSRKVVKKQLKEVKESDPDLAKIYDGLQYAYKITCNAVYGQIGSNMNSYGDYELAESITAFGRNMLIYAKSLVESSFNGSKTVYGDTDSIFMKFLLKNHSENCFNHQTNMRQRMDKLRSDSELTILDTPDNNKDLIMMKQCDCCEINDKMSKEAFEESLRISGFAEELVTNFMPASKYRGGVNHLEYEKTYSPLIMLSKKVYVGTKYTDDYDNGKLHSMGGILAKRDCCDLLKSTYTECVNLMFDGKINEALKYLTNIVNNIESTPIDQLVITKAYNKKPEEYKTKQPHVELVRRLEESGSKITFQIGDRIPFCITLGDGGIKEKLYTRSEIVENIIDKNLTLDYYYYINNQLKTPLMTLFKCSGHNKQVSKICNGASKRYKGVTKGQTRLNFKPVKK